MTAEPTGAEDWIQRYETLRRESLTPQSLLQTTPLGLALLIRHGVAQWMRRWLLEPQDPALSERSTVVVPITEGQDQLALLLAQVAMQHFQAGYSQ